MRYITTTIATIVLVLSPVFVSAQADPHTNITPIETQVVQNIDSFITYAQSGDVGPDKLSEAITDLQAVLDFYVRTLQ